uniref:hypothetical protein n=1 Tax=Bacteroides sp. TaxID=29523 RepID=UPI003AAC8446
IQSKLIFPLSRNDTTLSQINNSCSLLVYNKKGFPFVSDYKRDIFDKYTVIYWIQESYDLIFVFFRGDAST